MKNNAFSLVEVIISVGILAVGIVSVLQALAFSSRVAGLSNDMVEAAFLADDKIQKLEFLAEMGQPINNELLNEENGKFQWSYTAALDNDLAAGLNLQKLTSKISWQRINRKETITCNTYLRK